MIAEVEILTPSAGVAAALLAFVVTIYFKFDKIVDKIASRVRERAAVESQPSSVNILPNPLQMEPVAKFATAEAFGRHVAASRAEDEKLRNETLRVERELGHKLHVAKDEIMKAGNERESRLADKIDKHHEAERGRVDKLMEGMGEMRGMIHHLVNTTTGKKGGA